MGLTDVAMLSPSLPLLRVAIFAYVIYIGARHKELQPQKVIARNGGLGICHCHDIIELYARDSTVYIIQRFKIA